MRMNLKLLSTAAILLAIGCSSTQTDKALSVAALTLGEEGSAASQVASTFETYSAEAFFQTTSYSLASGTGYAFSSDGSKVLASSDASGVFNAIALDADGTVTELTGSETDAHFAVSFFPSDDRVLVSADQGGNELDHIYVREIDGTLRDLTEGDKVKANFGGWQADGEIFYVWSNARDPAAFDLYAYKNPGQSAATAAG